MADQDALAAAADAIRHALVVAVDGGTPVLMESLRVALAGLYDLNPLTERLVATMSCVRRYGHALAVARLDAEDVAGRLRVEAARRPSACGSTTPTAPVMAARSASPARSGPAGRIRRPPPAARRPPPAARRPPQDRTRSSTVR